MKHYLNVSSLNFNEKCKFTGPRCKEGIDLKTESNILFRKSNIILTINVE